MITDDFNTNLDSEMYNPGIFDETFSDGEFYDNDDYINDRLNGYDLPSDEMSYNDFSELEASEFDDEEDFD